MTRVSQTRPGHGSGCPWVRVRVKVRAPVTRAQPISNRRHNTTASPSNYDHRPPTTTITLQPRTMDQRRHTTANEGQSRPTVANDEGGMPDNRAQTTRRVV